MEFHWRRTWGELVFFQNGCLSPCPHPLFSSSLETKTGCTPSPPPQHFCPVLSNLSGWHHTGYISSLGYLMVQATSVAVYDRVEFLDVTCRLERVIGLIEWWDLTLLLKPADADELLLPVFFLSLFCCRAGLVVLNSLSFCLSVKLLISLSNLNEIVAG